MRPSFINFAGDPFNSDTVSEFPHQQSVGYSGTNEDVTAPEVANYPPETPTRYFLYLPFVPDTTDLAGARPMLVKDATGGVPLTRVTGVPGVNQYRVAPDDSRTPHVIELNSGQAGNVIAYDFYSIGSIISADEAQALNPVGSIQIYGSSDIPDGYLNCDGSSLLRTEYKALYNVIGTNFGTADGTHFNIPDLRGAFLRGQDEGQGVDTSAGSRTVLKAGGNSGDEIGSYQDSANKSHSHVVPINGGILGSTYVLETTAVKTNGSMLGSLTNMTTAADIGGVADARPRNVYVRFIIKY